MEELTERSIQRSKSVPAVKPSREACGSDTFKKEEAVLMKAMDCIGQWPSRGCVVDDTYAKSLRGSAEKLSRYKPSDTPPQFLVEALKILTFWPPKDADLLSEEQLEIRAQVDDLYDRWITARRLRFVEY